MRRPSPWLLIACLAYAGYFVLLVYCSIDRPEAPGISVSFAGSPPVVSDVAPGLPAARAGVRRGDRILDIDGRPVRSRRDLETINTDFDFDRPRLLRLERDRQILTVPLEARRTRLDPVAHRDELFLLAFRVMQAITLAIGMFVALKRPRDPVALAGAWVLLTAGVFSISLPYRIAGVWRGLGAAGVPLWLPFLSTYAAGGLFYLFFSLFPRRRFQSLTRLMLALAPLGLLLIPYTVYRVRMIYWPASDNRLPDWVGTLLLFGNAAYALVAIVRLAIEYRSLTEVTEQRRVRVLLFGGVIACASGIAVLVAQRGTAGDFSRGVFASTGVTLATLLLLLFPLSFAYAILRHRLFDLTVIVRLGVRYALARGALLSVVPALALILAIDLILRGDEPLMSVVSSRALVYLPILALAVAAHVNRQRWLDALDRRFFRERYDARQLLQQLVTDIRTVGVLDELTPRAIARIDQALHPEFAAIAVCRPGESRYSLLRGSPDGLRLPDADTKVMRLMQVLGRPIDLSRDRGTWLEAQLGPADLTAVRDARIDLLVPVIGGPDETSLVLALGPRRSEEPYSREDCELLQTVAESLALLTQRGDRRTPLTISECPTCGTCYDSGERTCAREGAPLTTSNVPRVLASRYRLDRRLGRGGMGVVYGAWDLSLDRNVAAKVICDELLGSPAVVERFQHEARAAARFSHPNVVTVHDFGVARGNVAYLIMELLDGPTLREVLRTGPLSPRRALRIVQGIAAAVDAAHAARMIHRDLKPENILLAQQGDDEIPKVLDFGIAKSLALDRGGEVQALTAQGTLVGTPSYMAPEQLRGENPSPAWDLWALGLIAHEMLIGVHPFAAEDDQAWPARPGDAVEYHDFFGRALAIDPARRFESAKALAAALEDAVATAHT